MKSFGIWSLNFTDVKLNVRLCRAMSYAQMCFLLQFLSSQYNKVLVNNLTNRKLDYNISLAHKAKYFGWIIIQFLKPKFYLWVDNTTTVAESGPYLRTNYFHIGGIVTIQSVVQWKHKLYIYFSSVLMSLIDIINF